MFCEAGTLSSEAHFGQEMSWPAIESSTSTRCLQSGFEQLNFIPMIQALAQPTSDHFMVWLRDQFSWLEPGRLIGDHPLINQQHTGTGKQDAEKKQADTIKGPRPDCQTCIQVAQATQQI